MDLIDKLWYHNDWLGTAIYIIPYKLLLIYILCHGITKLKDNDYTRYKENIPLIFINYILALNCHQISIFNHSSTPEEIRY